MHESNAIPKKPLLLALLIGICGDAFLSVLTESVVPFSFFPLIALLLAAYQLYQHYRHEPIVGNTPSCILLCFFIGAFGHTALLKDIATLDQEARGHRHVGHRQRHRAVHDLHEFLLRATPVRINYVHSTEFRDSRKRRVPAEDHSGRRASA